MAKNVKLSEEMEANIKNYASQIKTLESFIEAVRLRPGMYVSGIGNKGFMHLIKEVFQNSIDELQRDYSPCDHIWVTYDERSHLVEVTDNGRGLPFGEIVRICTNSHTSSNYDKKEGDYTAGTNGVGIKCVNALSSKFVVESYVLGKAKRVEFTDGIPWDKMELDIPNEGRQGTYIAFMPAYDVMGNITTTVKEVYDLIYALVPLMKIGAVVDFVGTDINGVQKAEQFVNEDGIIQHLIMKTVNPLIKPVIMHADCGEMKADIAFTYDANDMSVESISSFSNLCITIGGTHVDGFLDGLCTYFRNYMNRIYLANNNKLSVINNDIKTGLKAVVSVHCLTPIFSGQAKEILNNEEMRGFAKDLVYKSLEEFGKNNSSDLQKLCKYFKDIAEIRVKSDESKIKLKDKYSASILSGMPKKYAKPSGNKNLELFICEGDSALGSIKNSRDVTFQGVFPIRGKLPNAFTTVKSKFLANEEIASIITIIGGGYGKNFDIDKVKWDKIIFATDADSDGYHIASLLMRFFLMYMPEMILAGRVYKSVPPLYSIKGSKNRLMAALLMGKQQGDGQAGIIADQTSGGCGSKEIVLHQDALVGSTELDHQFLFLVVCQKCNVHYSHSFYSSMGVAYPIIRFAIRRQAAAAPLRV